MAVCNLLYRKLEYPKKQSDETTSGRIAMPSGICEITNAPPNASIISSATQPIFDPPQPPNDPGVSSAMCNLSASILPVASNVIAKKEELSVETHEIPIELSPQQLASEAIKFVKNICVYEADNRGGYFNQDSNLLGSILERANNLMVNGSLLLKADIALSLRMGRCGEQSRLLACYLLARGVDNFKFINMEGEGNHTFVVLNLPEDSNLLDPDTIPPAAIVVDPWAEETYPAKEFASKNRQGFLRGTPMIHSWQSYYRGSEEIPLDSIAEACKKKLVNSIKQCVDRNRLPEYLLHQYRSRKVQVFEFKGYTQAEFQALQKSLIPVQWKNVPLELSSAVSVAPDA